MAKGNLLLGTAGNSVGDIVMYRREGAQVSRVRVRKIKNPKTDAQSLQRAAFSPVSKFYSPLAVVLERSFEGLSKMKSYNKFLKTNIDLARANGWLLPKGTGFFPLPYKLSSGSLPQLNYRTANNGLNFVLSGTSAVPSDFTTIGHLSTLFINEGYRNGDVITIIVITGAVNTDFVPVVNQFIIDNKSSALMTDVFKGVSVEVDLDISGLLLLFKITGSMAAGAGIVARYQNDVWRRSSQNLVVATTILSTIGTDNYKAAAIASYGATNTGDNPLVYLDGDTLEG